MQLYILLRSYDNVITATSQVATRPPLSCIVIYTISCLDCLDITLLMARSQASSSIANHIDLLFGCRSHSYKWRIFNLPVGQKNVGLSVSRKNPLIFFGKSEYPRSSSACNQHNVFWRLVSTFQHLLYVVYHVYQQFFKVV